MKCPQCKSTEVYRSHRRGFVEEFVLRLVSKAPFQCESCQHRFVRQVHQHHEPNPAKRKNTLVFVAGLIIALFAALVVVEWGNRPPAASSDSTAP